MMDPDRRILIRVRMKMDPDPCQNALDPQLCGKQ